MSQVTATFRVTIISLMIVSGAINTIGISFPTQLTSSKISRWSSRGNSTNISSTPTCKYPSQHAGNNYVLRRGTSLRHLPLHEAKRPRDLQHAHARCQIPRKIGQLQ